MAIEGKLQLLTQGLLKSSRFMNRDFLELENMQRYSKKNYDFVKKSNQRLIESLTLELSKLQSKILFSAEDLDEEVANFVRRKQSEVDSNQVDGLYQKSVAGAEGAQKFVKNSFGRAITVSVDGYDNFVNALPFFSVMVTGIGWDELGNISARDSAIIFPALGELFYTSRGKGVFRERLSGNTAGTSKTRVSGNIDSKEILIGCSRDNIEIAKRLSDNFRVFECDPYLLSLFVGGKLDSVILKEGISFYGYELFIKESGGFLRKSVNEEEGFSSLLDPAKGSYLLASCSGNTSGNT